MIRQKLKLLLFIVALLPLLYACGPTKTTPEPEPQPKNTITEAGGQLKLEDGGLLVFEAGFLKQKAELSLKSIKTSEGVYSAAVKKDYPIDSIEAVGNRLEIVIPSSAIADSGKQLNINIPLFTTDYVSERGDEIQLNAEIYIKRADAVEFFYLEPYQPSSDVSGGVSIANSQLLSSASGDVKIVVRPVIEKSKITTLGVPSGFVFEDVVGGLNAGVVFDFAPDGRIFIGEKSGLVKVFYQGNLLQQPFIDLRDEVNDRGDRGMLGLAVHPDFPVQPYIYFLYTYDPPEVFNNTSDSFAKPNGNGARVSRLIRVTADASQGYNKVVPGSKVVLLGKNSTWANIGNPFARNDYSTTSCGSSPNYVQDCIAADEQSHVIGTVKFGADGSLFVGSGDGCDYTKVEAECIRSQDLNSLNGKLLRIDPITGKGLSSNPFYNGNPNANRSKVYSYGLRNPFRFTIHPSTGEPFLGDVGWGTWEEVVTGRGKNFGWPCYEGGNTSNIQQGGYSSLASCQSLYNSNQTVTPPVYGYVHVGGSSIQVGDFYTGNAYPAQYKNALFISDFNQKWIKYLKFNSSGAVTSVNSFGTEAGIVQTTVGPDTNLYVMNIYQGKIKRLRYTAAGNHPPVAVASANKTSGSAPLSVQFSSQGTYDPDNNTLTYNWNFGDGTSSTSANPSHTFNTAGNFNVVLTVTDHPGATNTDSLTINVNNTPPTAIIQTPTAGTKYNVGSTINFSGKGTDPEDGNLPAANLSWEVKLHHHDHTHFDVIAETHASSGSFVVEDHGDNTYLEICLTATDSTGASNTKCRNIYPNTVSYTLRTVPSGLELPWEGTNQTTPFTVTTIVGASQQLIAPSQQGSYSFSSWSDGGARSHSITVGSSPKTFTATYTSNSSCGGLSQEAEAGTVFGSFAVANDSNASGGKYVAAPRGSGSNYSFSTPNRVEYCVHVNQAGKYRVKGWVYATDSNHDSFFVQIDDQPANGYLWDTKKNTSYAQYYLYTRAQRDPIEVNLSAGDHSIVFYLREDDTRLDRFTFELVGTNRAPVVSNISNQTSTVGANVSLQVNAGDADNDILSYSASGLPAGLSINSSTGKITGSPTTAQTKNVTITVSDGNAQDSTSFSWTINSASSCGGLIQEAEDASLFGTIKVGNDASASGGKYIYAATGTGEYYGGPSENHKAEFCVNITNAGSYRIKTWVKAADKSHDSYFVRVDGQPVVAYIWDTVKGFSFAEDFVSTRGGGKYVTINLSAGEHTISFYQREEETKLDKIQLEPVQASQCGALSQEAESGSLSGNMAIGNDSAASGGKYVSAPDGSGFIWQGPSDNKVVYCVNIVNPGTYKLKAWVYGANDADDSFFVTMDGLPATGYLWDIQVNTSYAADELANRHGSDPQTMYLNAAQHNLTFYQREDGTRLDKFQLIRIGN